VIVESSNVDSEDRERLFRKYSSIIERCRAEESLGAVQELARFVATASADKLCAEEVANDVVRSMFLPYLSDDSTPEDLQLSILDALAVLLKNSKHASALMAPLVNNEIVEGCEKEISNPIRCSLFEILQSRLLATPIVNRDKNLHLLERTCRCLVLALQAASRIDGTKKHAESSKMDLEPGEIQRFVIHVHQGRGQSSFRLKELSLELLCTLLRRHPDSAVPLTIPLLATAKHEARLLPKTTTCKACGYKGTSLLLDTLHESNSSAECRLVSNCIVELLNNAPFGLWLQPRRNVNPSRFPSGFQIQVLLGIESTIRTAKCCLSRRNSEQYTDSLPCLAKSLLMKTPFDSDNRVGSLAVELVGTMARRISEPSCSPKFRKPIEDVLAESMGGRITPQGEKTTMCFPVRTWLCGDQGFSFVKNQLQDASADSLGVFHSTKLLQAILRSCPQIICGDDDDGELWRLFACAVLKSSESGVQKVRQESLQLVEAFMRGRHEHRAVSQTLVDARTVFQLVLPLLSKMVVEGSASSKITSCGAYASFLPSDWDTVADCSRGKGGEGCLCHFDLLLNLCEDDETSNKVRTEAWKALGDMCSSYFSIICEQSGDGRFSSEAKLICEKVCQALVEAVVNSTSSVRGMALFAAGNIAQAVRHLANPELFDVDLLTQVAVRVLDRIDDDDAKVAGNSVRAVGHFCCLLCLKEYTSALEDADFDLLLFLDKAIHSLTNKVENVLSLSFGNGQSRSWTKRQAIKKHGWGACNSLATMFESGIIRVARQEGVSKAVCILFECVDQMHALLEKVVISSMHALRSVVPSTISRIYGKGEAMVDAVITCLLQMFERDTSLCRHKLEQETEVFLVHVLQSFTISDARRLILSERIQTSHIDFLYQWMVEKDCPAEVFGYFVLAMQSPFVRIDIQTEQRFSSRAMSFEPSGDDNEDEL